MRKDSGEVLLGVLIGLAVGFGILIIDAGNDAQEIADRTGIATSPLEVITEDPGGSMLTLIGPAAAGAGIGWAIDELSGNNGDSASSRDNNINVDGEDNNVSISIIGDSDNDSTNEDNDENDQDNSGNVSN